MKRYFIFFALALACSLGVKAQGISVADFYLATNDLTANTYGTEQFDQNGERCALIKIETTQKGFAFNVGSLGVTKVEEDHVGEIWVYVPHSVRRITIQHAQLGTLRDYYFPVAIESSRTYIMQLTAGNVTTIVEQDLGGSYLVMKVQPVSAMVFIDEQLRELKNDGSLSLLLPYGKHTYSVQAPNFISKSGVFNVGTQKVTLEIELQSSKAYITLQTKMSDSKIYLNDEYLGQGSWTGYLSAGMYLAEARKDGYRSTREPFSIAEREERTITIPDPIAIYGKLQVESDPVECEVWIDGKKVGTTPDLFSNLLAGNHNLSLVKNGYETIEQTVNIEEARISTVKLSLQPVAQKKTYVPSTQQEAPVAKPTPNVESNQKPAVPAGYVDLGLPSGTLWKDKNEKRGFYTYDKAMKAFGNNLPTKEQFEELKSSCNWTWTGNGYKVTGPSGASITLPAAGYRDGSGVRRVGSDGRYWSSTPYGSDLAYSLNFRSTFINLYSSYRDFGFSVRLVAVPQN